MAADGADLGRAVSQDQVAAVPAEPDRLPRLAEDRLRPQPLQQAAVALLMALLHRRHQLKLPGQVGSLCCCPLPFR